MPESKLAADTSVSGESGKTTEGTFSIRSDTALKHPRDDELDRKDFARNLALAIEGAEAPEGVVIALSGEWGAGKSTLINFAVSELEEGVAEEGVKLVIARFNPWWFSGRSELAGAFLTELRARVGGTPLLRYRLRRFAGKTTRVLRHLPVRWASNVAGVATELLGSDPSLATSKNRVVRSIKRRNKRMVVVIDDVDRLEPEEAAALLAVIKALGDFPNTVYLIACDLEFVGRQLDTLFSGEGRDYVSKVVQVEFPVPQLRGESVLALLGPELDRIIGKADQDLFDEGEWNDALRRRILKMIDTPRDVVRLANSLSLTYPAVRGDVNVVDFVLVEALRVFEPRVYDSLRNDPVLFGDDFMGIVPNEQVKAKRRDRLAALMEPIPDNGRREAVKETVAFLRPDVADLLDVPVATRFKARRRRLLADDLARERYFTFGLNSISVSKSEVAAAVAATESPEAFSELMEKAEKTEVAPGLSRLAIVLGEIEIHVDDVRPENVPHALAALVYDADTRIDFEESLRVYPLPIHSAISSLFGALLLRLNYGDRLNAASTALARSGAITAPVILLRRLSDHAGVPEEVSARTLGAGHPGLTSAPLAFEELANLEVTVCTILRQRSADDGFMDIPRFVWVLIEWQVWDREGFEEWFLQTIRDDSKLEKLLYAFRRRYYSRNGEFRESGEYEALARLGLDAEISEAIERLFVETQNHDLRRLCAEYMTSAPDQTFDESILLSARDSIPSEG